MRLQRDSYAPKSCAFDAANVQFLRAHLCKSHPVLQHWEKKNDGLYNPVPFTLMFQRRNIIRHGSTVPSQSVTPAMLFLKRTRPPTAEAECGTR